MTQGNIVTAELAREARSARAMIERLPAEQLDWRPHAKSRSLGELAWHMASVPGVVSGIALKTEQERSEVPWPPRPALASEVLLGFDSSIGTAIANLATLDDAAMEQEFKMVNSGHTLFQMARLAVLRWAMMTHFIHHRAQLGLYLRLLDVDVPAMVGPSADDNPFLPKP